MRRLIERLTRRRRARGSQSDLSRAAAAHELRCARCHRVYHEAVPGHPDLCWWCTTMTAASREDASGPDAPAGSSGGA